MDTVLELAFEGVRMLGRLLLAALELLFEGLRPVGRVVLEILVEVVVDAIARPCVRLCRRVHAWVGLVTGLPQLAIPLSILLIMAVLAGACVAIVKIGQAIFI